MNRGTLLCALSLVLMAPAPSAHSGDSIVQAPEEPARRGVRFGLGRELVTELNRIGHLVGRYGGSELEGPSASWTFVSGRVLDPAVDYRFVEGVAPQSSGLVTEVTESTFKSLPVREQALELLGGRLVAWVREARLDLPQTIALEHGAALVKGVAILLELSDGQREGARMELSPEQLGGIRDLIESLQRLNLHFRTLQGFPQDWRVVPWGGGIVVAADAGSIDPGAYVGVGSVVANARIEEGVEVIDSVCGKHTRGPLGSCMLGPGSSVHASWIEGSVLNLGARGRITRSQIVNSVIVAHPDVLIENAFLGRLEGHLSPETKLTDVIIGDGSGDMKLVLGGGASIEGSRVQGFPVVRLGAGARMAQATFVRIAACDPFISGRAEVHLMDRSELIGVAETILYGDRWTAAWPWQSDEDPLLIVAEGARIDHGGAKACPSGKYLVIEGKREIGSAADLERRCARSIPKPWNSAASCPR